MHDVSPVDRVLAAREAGRVKRCHGTPHHSEYTVGKHSFDAACMVFVLHPGPSLELVQAVLFHDAAERWVGDLPAPVLHQYPELKAHYEAAEADVRKRKGLHLPELNELDAQWLRGVDRLELMHWCRDELMHGNGHVANMYNAVVKSLAEMELPTELRDYFNQLRQSGPYRTSEL